MPTRKIKAEVRKAVNLELLLANGKHSLFASPHEGYAVIMEEVEEAIDESEKLENALSSLWKAVKDNSHNTIEFINHLEEAALDMACEAIQVAAMAEKFRQSILVNSDGN